MAENVDKLKQESETKVTIVLKICEQVVEQLRMYETQLKIAEQQLGRSSTRRSKNKANLCRSSVKHQKSYVTRRRSWWTTI
jgi:hypothetical protein